MVKITLITNAGRKTVIASEAKTLGFDAIGIADPAATLGARVKLEAFTSFVSVVSYGTEIGAPIAQTLKMHGSDLRRERFNLAERKAARAPSVMILPLVLFIMPSVFIIVLTPMIIRFMKTF